MQARLVLVVETTNEQQATTFLFEQLGIFVGALKQPGVSIERARHARQSR
jgi:hypothetical protein